MLYHRNYKGQSMVEYAILLGVVIAALLIMQVFVKRGFQGGLKEASDKMGDQFSAGATTIYQNRTLGESGQTIKQESGTNDTMADFVPSGMTVKGTVEKGAYSYSERTGDTQTSETSTKTDAATQEKTRWNEYSNKEYQNFTGDNTQGWN